MKPFAVQMSEQTFNRARRPHTEAGWMRLTGIPEAAFLSKGLSCRAAMWGHFVTQENWIHLIKYIKQKFGEGRKVTKF